MKDIIWKTGVVQDGVAQAAPNGTDEKLKRIVRAVPGHSVLLDPAGVTETDTYLGLDGMSHFKVKSDERIDMDQAPSGLGHLAAGIAFCYMTQIGRYSHMAKLPLEAYRVVQDLHFTLGGASGGSGEGGTADPVETHVFVDADISTDAIRDVVRVAEKTCFLHALCRDRAKVKIRRDPISR